MSNQVPTPEPDDQPPNEEAGAIRDVLAVFNAEGVVDEPGRPSANDPGETIPADADVPPPQ